MRVHYINITKTNHFFDVIAVAVFGHETKISEAAISILKVLMEY